MQNAPLRCSRCGAPAEAGQRFCAECGALLDNEGNKPTERASGDSFVQANTQAAPGAPRGDVDGQATIASTPQPQGSAPNAFSSPFSTVPASFNRQTTEADVIPPPPPPDSYITQLPAAAPSPAPASSLPPGVYEVPSYARVPRRSRGCLVISIVLLLVLVAVAAAIYYGFR